MATNLIRGMRDLNEAREEFSVRTFNITRNALTMYSLCNTDRMSDCTQKEGGTSVTLR